MSTSGASDGCAATLALVRAVAGVTWGKTPEAARGPLSNLLMNEIVKGERSSEAALIGRKQRSTWLTAALFNGAALHALDFDDTRMAMSGHPSVPVVAAVLAPAETTGANGRTLLESIVAGIEIGARADALGRGRVTHRS
jgi:2-methylcitrate dehydratase PrpD